MASIKVLNEDNHHLFLANKKLPPSFKETKLSVKMSQPMMTYNIDTKMTKINYVETTRR
jgi:hypothetical protein